MKKITKYGITSLLLIAALCNTTYPMNYDSLKSYCSSLTQPIYNHKLALGISALGLVSIGIGTYAYLRNKKQCNRITNVPYKYLDSKKGDDVKSVFTDEKFNRLPDAMLSEASNSAYGRIDSETLFPRVVITLKPTAVTNSYIVP